MDVYEVAISQLVFVGFGKYVVALHRDNGKIIWQWKVPKGQGYPAILLDRDRLIVSSMGYTYCLDPITGEQLWENELAGMGIGVACIATTAGNTNPAAAAAAAQAAQANNNTTP